MQMTMTMTMMIVIIMMMMMMVMMMQVDGSTSQAAWRSTTVAVYWFWTLKIVVWCSSTSAPGCDSYARW